jgi:hypothetical protein
MNAGLLLGGLAPVQNQTKLVVKMTIKLPKTFLWLKEIREICHISFTFSING